MLRGMVSSLPMGLVDSSIPKLLDDRFILHDRLACRLPTHLTMNASDLFTNRCFNLRPYHASMSPPLGHLVLVHGLISAQIESRSFA